MSTLSISKEEHKELCMNKIEEMKLGSDVSSEKFFEIMMDFVYEKAYIKGEWDERKRQEARS